MAKTKRAVFLAAIMVFAGVVFVPFANANETSVSLEAEIQNLERIANRQDVPPEQRHDAIVRLARLRQLSGDIEGAAKYWLEAAAAVPGQVDDDALLACAYCLAAMGEWDRARTALEPLLPKSARARFLYISIDAISTGSTAMLAVIADNPEYSQMKSEVLFLLWRMSSGSATEIWRQRLATEFPQSPEGRLASGEVSSVAIRPSPFWLFIGGLDSLPLLASETTGRPGQVTVSREQEAVRSEPVPSSYVRLQTGLFSRQANAQAQAAALRQAGFSPSVEQRTVNNSEMWAVTVFAGADTNSAIAQLRGKGFEAFPVR